jgi:hypothetical protein
MIVCFLSAIFLILNAIIMMMAREPALAVIMYAISILIWIAGIVVMVLE